MKLTDTVMSSFQVCKVFEDNTARINAMDFSNDGTLLVTSSDDDSIHLYDPTEGTYVLSECLSVQPCTFGGTSINLLALTCLQLYLVCAD